MRSSSPIGEGIRHNQSRVSARVVIVAERTTASRSAAENERAFRSCPRRVRLVRVMRKTLGLVLVVVGACGGSVDDGSGPGYGAGNHGGGKGGKESGEG